jgi:hypothetical protein
VEEDNDFENVEEVNDIENVEEDNDFENAKIYKNKDLQITTLIYTHSSFHKCLLLVCSYFTVARALLNNNCLCESEHHYGRNLKYFPSRLVSRTQ